MRRCIPRTGTVQQERVHEASLLFTSSSPESERWRGKALSHEDSFCFSSVIESEEGQRWSVRFVMRFDDLFCERVRVLLRLSLNYSSFQEIVISTFLRQLTMCTFHGHSLFLWVCRVWLMKLDSDQRNYLCINNASSSLIAEDPHPGYWIHPTEPGLDPASKKMLKCGNYMLSITLYLRVWNSSDYHAPSQADWSVAIFIALRQSPTPLLS